MIVAVNLGSWDIKYAIWNKFTEEFSLCGKCLLTEGLWHGLHHYVLKLVWWTSDLSSTRLVSCSSIFCFPSDNLNLKYNFSLCTLACVWMWVPFLTEVLRSEFSLLLWLRCGTLHVATTDLLLRGILLFQMWICGTYLILFCVGINISIACIHVRASGT